MTATPSTSTCATPPGSSPSCRPCARPSRPCGARSSAPAGQISGVLRRAHETAAEITAQVTLGGRGPARAGARRGRRAHRRGRAAGARARRRHRPDLARPSADHGRRRGPVQPVAGARQAGRRAVPRRRRAGRRRSTASSPEVEPAAAEDAVAWERWADHDLPAAADGAAGDDAATDGTPSTSLTDSDETLPLAAAASIPQSPRRWSRVRRGSRPSTPGPTTTSADSPIPDSAGMIPPMSEAANRPRRP